MAEAGTMPMLSPDGQSGDIPIANVDAAMQSGFKPAIVMTSPDGKTGYVPHDKALDAMKLGFTTGMSTEEATKPQAQAESKGVISNFGSDLWKSIKGIGSLFSAPKDDAEKAIVAAGPGALQIFRMGKGYIGATQDTIARAKDEAEQGDATGSMINSTAAALPLVGPLVSGVYEQAKSGDTKGAIGAGASRALQLASMAPEGSAIPNPISIAGKAAAPIAESLYSKSARMYQSALKPSTVIPESKVASMVQTGLQNRIPVSEAGAAKISSLVDDLNDKITQEIAGGQGKTINKFQVASRLSDTAKKFATQVNPNADLNAVAESGNEFLDTQPNEIPAADAQAIKQGTYKQLGDKAYGGELGTAAKEAQKSLARGIKEELANQFPELNQLNSAEGKLLDLQPVLERALKRIGNHQLMGIGTPIAAGGLKAVTGSTGIAAAGGILRAIMENPMVKSRLAIALSHAPKMTYGAATARVTAYVNALNGAGESGGSNAASPSQ